MTQTALRIALYMILQRMVTLSGYVRYVIWDEATSLLV